MKHMVMNEASDEFLMQINYHLHNKDAQFLAEMSIT